MHRILTVCALLVAFSTPSSTRAQPLPTWQEHSGARHNYNLSGVRILVLVAEQFNDEEAAQMAACWRGWGAKVEFAGPARLLTGEVEGPAGRTPGTVPTIRVDRLLPDVDPSHYDVIYLAGGEGVAGLLERHRPQLARILDGAARRGRLIAAICHAPLALTASSVVKGKRVTANGQAQVRALEEAGATFVDDTVVVDGRLVTGQWPQLETFAVTVAEKLQYPSGGGPFEKSLAARPAGVRLVQDQRRTTMFKPQAIDFRAIEQAIQSAMATTARSSGGPVTVKYVLVSDAGVKARLWEKLVESSKAEFAAMGLNEQGVRRAFGPTIETAPAILCAFVLPARAATPDRQDRALRGDLRSAGASLAGFAIAARALGVGVAMFDYEPFMRAEGEIKQLLRIPDAATVVGVMAVGRPAAEAPRIPVRPVSEVLSYEAWGSPSAVIR